MVSQSESKKLYIFVFLIAVIIFLSSILLVFIMQGKRIGKDGDIIETGVIRLNTLPSEVEAYINDQRYSINDKVIQNVPKGEIDLKLTKDGYTSWHKKINVLPGLVKDISAQLFPIQFNLEQFSQLNIDKIGYSTDFSYAFFTVLDSEIVSDIGLWKIRLNFNTLDLNRSTDPELVLNFTGEQVSTLRDLDFKIMASQNADKVIIYEKEKSLVWEIDISDKILSDISKNLGFFPTDIKFLNKSEDLLINKDNVIYTSSSDFSQKQLISLDLDLEKFLCSSEDVVYYYDDNLKEVFKVENGKHEVVLNNLEKGFGEIHSMNCSRGNKNVITLKTERGLWYIDLEKKQEELFTLSGELSEISANGNTIIYSQEGRLFVASKDLVSKDLKLRNKEILNTDEFEFKFSNDGLNILKYNDAELYLLDLDGENAYKLIESASFDVDSVLIQGNRKEIYAVIQNTSEAVGSITSVSQNFLYKINLQ